MTPLAAGFTDPAASGYGTMGVLLAQSAQVRARLDTLTRQASNGRVSDSFAGLGAQADISLSLRPELTRLDTWRDNIAAIDGRMQAGLSSLDQIGAIASTFRARTYDLNGLSAIAVDAVAANARDALRQVAGLLNARYGDDYVFSGQDSGEPAVPDADAILTSGFVTQIGTAVAGLGVNGAAATIAATLSIGQSNAAGTSPFSATLSQPAPNLQPLRSRAPVGDGRSVETGVVASANSEATSSGASTTGSYIRDVLRALATLGSLSSASMSQPGFAGLVADTRSSLDGAIGALNVDAGVMGSRLASVRALSSQHEQTTIALKAQLANVEDVDMAATLSKLTQTQTQLQASYQLLAGLQSLSLTKFLAAS